MAEQATNAAHGMPPPFDSEPVMGPSPIFRIGLNDPATEVFRGEALELGDSFVIAGLLDEDVERIADRVVEKMRGLLLNRSD